ncbi:sodium/potassium/calcium exchanger 1-like isoform X1 [Polyodon spathula]|uniref:sodium/potassium/calcium exchanger 1-like isoform X1 n=1 Tax=Polyodon spathula TaxID=7913 RepID=UPI001B7F158C|nr:sodium/potassium/calcium exchanger 1-like isoform X1 [Polyodon spathula]
MDQNFDDFLNEAFTTDAFLNTDDVYDRSSLDEEYDFQSRPSFMDQVKETENDAGPAGAEGQTQDETGDPAGANRQETELFRDKEITEAEGESGGEEDFRREDASPGLPEEDYVEDHLEKNSHAPVVVSEEGGLGEDYKEQAEEDLGAVQGAGSLSGEEEDLEVSGNDKKGRGHFESALEALRREDGQGESSDEDQGVCLDEETWERISKDQFSRTEGGWDVNLPSSKEEGEVLNVVQYESGGPDTDEDMGVEDEDLVGHVLDVHLEEGEGLQVRSEEDLEETHQEVAQRLFANWGGSGTEDLVNYHLDDDSLKVIPEDLEPDSLKDLDGIDQVEEEEEEEERRRRRRRRRRRE